MIEGIHFRPKDLLTLGIRYRARKRRAERQAAQQAKSDQLLADAQAAVDRANKQLRAAQAREAYERAQKERLALLQKDEVKVVPRAAELAKLCTESGYGYVVASHVPEKGQEYAGSIIYRVGGNDELLKVKHNEFFDESQWSNKAQAAVRGEQARFAREGTEPHKLSSIIDSAMTSGDIKSADIMWGFKADANTPNRIIIGVKATTVSPAMLGWADEHRQSKLIYMFSVPEDVAKQLRAAPLTNGDFARSFIQQSLPKSVARTHTEARGEQPGSSRKLQLEPLPKNPVITVKDHS